MVIDITQNTILEKETLVAMSLNAETCYVDNVSHYTLGKIKQCLIENTNLMQFISYKGSITGLALYEVSPKVDIYVLDYPTYRLYKGDLLHVFCEPVYGGKLSEK